MFKFINGLRLAIAISLTCTVASIAGYSVKADEQTWLNTNLSLQKIDHLTSGQTPPYSINGNRDCQDYEFITRPKILLQAPLSHYNCGVQTAFGMADPNGWLELSGTQTSGKLINYPGFPTGFIPIPSSSRFINYSSAPQGLFLFFTDFSQEKVITSQNLDHSVNYQLNQPPFTALKDKSGALLQAQTDSMSFSSNGKWMVVDSPGRAMLRVNLETLEVLPFAQTLNYSIGINPGLQTTITSDGRYAVIYSYGFNTFKIYDLSTCTGVPDIISQPVNCQSKDLLSIPRAQINNFRGISRLRFVLDSRLEFYANNYLVLGDASTNQISKYLLSLGSSGQAKSDYLAMGDSYISGEGAYSYKVGSDTNTNHCHQSLVSYPYIVGSSLGYNSYPSVACSGAVNWDITFNGPDYEGQVKDGIKRIDRENINDILDQFQPGYINQLDFVSYAQPKAVTISIGGNDIGFSTILRRCLEPDTCYSSYEDRVEIVRQVNTVLPKLLNTYKKIKDAAPPSAKIYAVGYPQLAEASGDCANNVRLNSQELEFASQLVTYLDSVIKIATQRAGIGYINTQQALDGHKLCETKSNDVAVNGITAGNDQPDFIGGPLGNETYHPNALGHQLLANAVIKETDGLNSVMPSASNPSLPTEENLDILNAPQSGRQINRLNYDDNTSNNVAYRQSWWDVTLDGFKFSLKAASSVAAVLYSEPTSLGNLITDQNGSINGKVFIPSNVEPGFHTLHLYAQNMAGEQVDIVKSVYIASTSNDYDGDAIDNSADSCKYFPNSGSDYDGDNVDDTCDGQITEPPQEAAQTKASTVDLGASTAGNTTSTVFTPLVRIGGSGEDSGSNREESGSSVDPSRPKTLSATTKKSMAVISPKHNDEYRPLTRYGYGLVFLSATSLLGIYLSKKFT